jgi:hypothetical protein
MEELRAKVETMLIERRKWRAQIAGLALLMLYGILAIMFAAKFGLLDKRLGDWFYAVLFSAVGVILGVIGVSRHWFMPGVTRVVRGVLLLCCLIYPLWGFLVLILDQRRQYSSLLLMAAIALLTFVSVFPQAEVWEQQWQRDRANEQRRAAEGADRTTD